MSATHLPDPVEVPDFEPSVKRIGGGDEAPQATSEPGDSGGALGAPGPTDQPYWASDGRHYVVVDGAWAYDYFEAATNDADGRPVPGEIGIYDALAPHTEQFVLDTNLAGYTAFRSPGDPVFNVVHWAAWPTGQLPTDSNMIYQVTVDGSISAWFTQADFSNIVNAGLGGRIGFATPAANTTSLWEDWTQHATNTNGVLFGQELNHTWFEPNCSGGCTSY